MKTTIKTLDVNAHITNVQAQVITENDGIKAKISFDNLGYGTITAVKFNAKGYNSFGDVVSVSGKDNFLIILQDISIPKNSVASDIKVKLPNPEIRKIELEENQICYSNGEISTYAGKKEVDFELEEFTYEEHKELTALKDVLDARVKYNITDTDYGWLCTCGRLNNHNSISCSLCGHTKSEVTSYLSEDGRKKAIEKKQALDAQRQAEAERQAKEKAKAEKRRKIKITVGLLIGLVIAIFIGRSIIMSDRTTYSSESEMKNALQGTYTYYDDSGKASKQIVISGDKATYKWSYNDDADMETTIRKWDYKNGKIKTFEELIVTNRGYLKDGDNIYKKGGYMSQGSSTNNSSSYESAYSALKFSNLKISSNSSYTICTGTITNNGKKTYKFVQIKGAFKNSSGTVIDTDSTYAVGSEGLAPGESKTFRMSVDKDYSISSCSVSIYDYD